MAAAPTLSIDRESILLVHAPIGRDARLLQELFHRARLHCHRCGSIAELSEEIAFGAGAVFITEEALTGEAIDCLSGVLSKQGPWSDLPLVVLLVGGEPSAASRARLALLEPLGDLTLLERPLRSDTIISAARTALRSRARQYEVRRRDAELQLVTDSVPVLISYIDPAQVHRRVNQTYFEWFGKQPEEVVGSTIHAVFGEPYSSRAQPFIVRALGGEQVAYESQVWDSRRQLRDVTVSYTPDHGIDGAVRGFTTLVQDVTHRKRAERRHALLVELDDAVRALTDPLEITQTAASLLGDHLEVNRCAYADVEADENTFNLTGDYNVGVPSIVGRYTFAQFGGECLRLMRDGEPFVVEDSETDPRTRGVRDAYRETRIRSTICVSIRKAGRFVGSLAVHQLTPRRWRPDEVDLVQVVADRCWESIERARVARELAASERRLRLAQRAGHAGSFEWMLKTGKIIWSPELEDLYGIPEGSFEGTIADWRKRIAADDADRFFGEIERCIADQVPECTCEFRALLPHGRTRWLRGHAQFFYNDQGEADRLIGINIDISEQRATEEELRRINSELEEFAYVASHDLQEPLRMVNIYTQQILRRLNGSDADLSQFGKFVRQGVLRMEALIKDLLTFSQMVHGESSTAGAASLTDSLTEALSGLKNRIEETGAAITFDPLPGVRGDKAQLAHVFQNILSNAIKYRKMGVPPRVHISARQTGDRWVISAEDNGIGFEQEYAERIFGLFKRLHGKEDYPGTGLGLAICKRIVERHGGQMWAEGRPGEGATFYFSLPESP
jgi:PAS domain S-box-containing protein